MMINRPNATEMKPPTYLRVSLRMRRFGYPLGPNVWMRTAVHWLGCGSYQMTIRYW